MNRLGLMIVGVAALVGWGQVWERFSNPTVNLQLRHPPGLGLNIKRMAFGPSSGPCADEIVDRLSARLVSGGIEVADRENLRVVLEEQKFGNSGAVDSATAAELGKLLGPMALVFLKVGRCNTQGRRNYTDTKVREGVIRTHRAIVELNIRGTLQTVDLNTGRIFAAQDLIVRRVSTILRQPAWEFSDFLPLSVAASEG